MFDRWAARSSDGNLYIQFLLGDLAFRLLVSNFHDHHAHPSKEGSKRREMLEASAPGVNFNELMLG